MNSNCSSLLDMRNLQEKVKKHSVTKKLFWLFTVWKNCSSDLKYFVNSRPSASNFKSFSRSQDQFFLTVGQNNSVNKIPELTLSTASTDMEFPPLFLQFCMFHRQIFQHSLDSPWHQPSKNHWHGRQFCFEQKRNPPDLYHHSLHQARYQ